MSDQPQEPDTGCVGFQDNSEIRCEVEPSWAVIAGGFPSRSLACGRHLAWVLGLRVDQGDDARVERL